MNATYTEDQIRTLDWREHIRKRPGMYIGKLGNGTAPDDGIYVLTKEIIDNSIDEHMMGFGKRIDISITDSTVTIRDNGRGIPLGKVVDCVSKINTGGKYDSEAFQKSVGLNGVGAKAVKRARPDSRNVPVPHVVGLLWQCVPSDFAVGIVMGKDRNIHPGGILRVDGKVHAFSVEGSPQGKGLARKNF